MQLIIDFSDSSTDGKMIIVPRQRLITAAIAIAAAAAVAVYLVANLVAAYWVTSDADIVADIVKKEIHANNEDRHRLWQESNGSLKDYIADINARVMALYRKGAILSNHIGLPGDKMFAFSDLESNGDGLLCTANEVGDDSAGGVGGVGGAGGGALSPEEQQIQISDLLYQQTTRLEELERKYSSLRDQGIYNIVLENTLPMERPLLGRNWISSRYGYRKDPFTGKRAFHAGDDYAARRGTPIIAAASGIVIYAGRRGRYGNTVQIHHGNDISTLYGHMHKIHIKPWQYVNQGDVIGTVGSTGRSTGPHLHYEVRIKNRPKSVIRTIKALRQQRNLQPTS